MEAIVLIICFVFLLVAYKIFFHNNKTNQNRKLPPSPPAIPILGHLHLLKQPIHRSLHNLSQKLGPIFYVRLGSRQAVVISSPSAVEECFTKNDIVLASRPLLIMGKYMGYDHTSIATCPYGDHWRNLRKISALEIFSTTRLNKFSSIRREEMEIFMKKLFRISSDFASFAKVKQLRQMFSELTFNIIMRMVTGKRHTGDGSEVENAAEKFRETVTEVFRYAGASYTGDFLPFLEWIDYQGYTKRMKGLAKRSDNMLQGLIDEQRNDNMVSRNSMISHLLTLQQSQPQYYTDEIIKSLIMDILLAGTESSAVTIEWIVANLLNHPQELQNARNEIDDEIGNEKMLDESDITKLPYLQNVISETFRLYPAGPLLLPHLSQSECTIGDFYIPKDTMVFINAWSMQRDPKLWDDAETFKPERFQQNQGENLNYKYMPFGLGRRACPGMVLANRVVGFAVGCMIQCFEWERVDDKEIDMNEGIGLTMPKAYPLEALCKPRHVMKTF
ncbi:Cytochrome P450 81Q32 [Euphorbia peplus]|nr:Cytochrome P450 81Q32 [Euphorbia peplus]